MCIFMEDEDDHYDSNLDPNDPSNVNSDSKRSGSKRWRFHNHHSWIIPRKPLLLVFALSLFFLLIGMLFMVIAGGIGSVIMTVIGALLFGFAVIGLIICLVVFVHAYFFYGLKDQSTQTTATMTHDDGSSDIPSFTSIGRPSALKSPDSTLKRNGTLGVKKVTMAPELGPYGEIQASNLGNNQVAVSPTGSSSLKPLHRLPSSSSAGSRSNSMPRPNYIDGSTVGTGGIKITPLDQNQPFPSPGSSMSGGQYYSTTGGGSSVSGSMDTYAYPRSVQLSFDASSNGSQYSTLRSIPVTHLDSGPGRQKHEEVHYASVNKPGATVVRVEHLAPQQKAVLSPSQGLLDHVHQGQSQSGVSTQRVVQTKDDSFNMDYDNTIERTPMLRSAQQHSTPKVSYHEKQIHFQNQQRRQHSKDLNAPRQVNSFSLQRQYAANPMILQHEQNDQQMQEYKMHYEQEKKQQQQQQQQQQQAYQTQYSLSNASSARNSMVDDVFEPQPLVYPSARRPMTFEQVSSSKMSVYDNVLANNLRENDEFES